MTLSGLLPLSWWEQRVRCKVRQNRLSALLAAVPNPCPHLLSAQEMPPAPSKPSGWGTRWPKSVSSCTRARSWQDPQSPHLSSGGSYPLREGVEAPPVGEGSLAYPGAPPSDSRGACSLSCGLGRTGFVGTTPPQATLTAPVSTLITGGVHQAGMPHQSSTLAFALFLSPGRHQALLFQPHKCPPFSLPSSLS